jgi:hypothetical protein
MDPIRKEGKKRALMHMRKLAMDHMKGGLDDMMTKKVSVMAPDEEGLEDGLQKAHDLAASGALDKMTKDAQNADRKPHSADLGAEDDTKHSEENSLHEDAGDLDHEPAGESHDGSMEDATDQQSTEDAERQQALHGGDEKKSPQDEGLDLASKHPFAGQEDPEEEDAEQELMAAADELTPEELDRLIASLQAQQAKKSGMLT